MSIKNLLVLFAFGFLLLPAKMAAQAQLTNIPTIYINTVGGVGITSKTIWVPGFLTVVGGDSSDVQVRDTIEIRGRGNSTWNAQYPKRPYRIKFSQKRHLLNMKDDARDWVLLANYFDKTLIRNAVAFDIGQYIGMEFTPSVKFADVYLNNVYIGNYLVTDQIEAGKNRVDIEKMDTTDIAEPNVSGGYLFERDGFNTGELVYFFTNKSVPFSVKDPDPEVIKPAQLTYLTTFLQNHENTLFSTNWKDSLTGYRAILDTASCLRWYIASELTGNIDCFWSTNMYKRRNDPKLYYGPLWDFDIAFNNDSRKNDISKVRMLTAAFGANGDNKVWITQMASDPWFKIGVNNMWKSILAKGVKAHIQSYIDSLVTVLDASIKKNYEKWPTLNAIVYNEWYKYPTYQEYVNVLKDYVNTRVDFLTTSFAADVANIPVVPPAPTPFKLENYYYSVTNKTSSTVMDLQSQSTLDSTRVVLYANTVDSRLSQQWKLVPMTDGSYQFINRYANKSIRSNGLSHTPRMFTNNLLDTRQRWKIVPLTTITGAYKLVNVSSGYVLENPNGATASNTYVNEVIVATTENTNQAWLLDKVAPLPVGLNDVPFALNLQYGPNPVSTHLFVQIDGVCTDARLDVLDLSGRHLLQQFMNSTEADLNVQSLADGLYILRFTAGQQFQTVKFLVKH
jgi:hypothetical protein